MQIYESVFENLDEINSDDDREFDQSDVMKQLVAIHGQPLAFLSESQTEKINILEVVSYDSDHSWRPWGSHMH